MSILAQLAGVGCLRIHRLHLCRRVRLRQRVAQSGEAIEYTDAPLQKGWTPLKECPDI